MAYIGRLQNGVTVPINNIDASSNHDYTNDPYYNFELPAGAINLTVVLTDNTSTEGGGSPGTGGTFMGADGWLMAQRGQILSSNVRLTPLTYWTDGLNDASDPSTGYQGMGGGLLKLVIPDATDDQPTAGEWFVSLDVEILLNDMTIMVSWDHVDGGGPTQLENVIDGSNGSLTDGTDVIFTLPASPDGGPMPSQAYWTALVPGMSTIGVVLDDNAVGDLAASITAGTNYAALAITTDAPYLQSGDRSNIAYQNTPFAVYYTNTGTSDQTVYVNVPSLSPTPFEGVRLLMTIVPGVILIDSSDTGGGGSGGGDGWVVNYQALLSSGIPTSDLTSATAPPLFPADFYAAEGNYPQTYLGLFPDSGPSNPASLNQGHDAFGRIPSYNDSNCQMVTVAEDGLSGVISYLWGFYPGTLLISQFPNSSGGTDSHLQGSMNTTFEQPAQAPFLYVMELVTATWSRSNVIVSPNFTQIKRRQEFAVVLTYSQAEGFPESSVNIDSISSVLQNSTGELSLLKDTGGSELTILSLSGDLTSIDIPYRNDSQQIAVSVYGATVTYNSSDDPGSDPTLLAFSNALDLLSETGLNQAGDTLSPGAANWATSLPSIFVDTTMSSNEVQDGEEYYVGFKIVHTQ